MIAAIEHSTRRESRFSPLHITCSSWSHHYPSALPLIASLQTFTKAPYVSWRYTVHGTKIGSRLTAHINRKAHEGMIPISLLLTRNQSELLEPQVTTQKRGRTQPILPGIEQKVDVSYFKLQLTKHTSSRWGGHFSSLFLRLDSKQTDNSLPNILWLQFRSVQQQRSPNIDLPQSARLRNQTRKTGNRKGGLSIWHRPRNTSNMPGNGRASRRREIHC